MRLTITILICKFFRAVLKKIGRGSSMPGKIALKLYPKVLSRVKMPPYIVAVTGSNGKTSTVEMIYEVLTEAGYTVAYNSEGSNQIDGVATLVLSNCDNYGKFTKDILLLESDERYAQYTFKYFTPTYYVITNLYRDQMTRNGNPEFVLNEIKKSIKPGCTLILNGDDPQIASLADNNKALYFGINKNKYSKKENNFIYNDGYYCPKCKNKLVYKYYQFGHIGDYHCKKCGFIRKKPKYYVSSIDLNNGKLIINGKHTVNLAMKSLHNAYNVLAAFAVASELNVKPKVIANSLSNYLIKNGRVKNFKLGMNRGTLLISKHENSVSYNQNIEYIINQNKECTIFLMVDAISRKYFTSETSWLWDINFELLGNKNVKNIIVTGQYAADIAERLTYANLDFNKVYVNANIKEAIEYSKKINNYIYVLTCFSDEKKFTNEVNALW